jgi:TP901 family phage tail tape measure protein
MASREDFVLQVSVDGKEQIDQLSGSLRSVLTAGKNLTRQTKEMDAKQRALSKAIGLTSKGNQEYARSLKEAIGNHKVISGEMKKLAAEAGKLNHAAKNLNGEFSPRQVRQLKTYSKGLKEMERNLKQVRPRALVNDLKSLSVQIKKAGKDAQFVGRSLIIGLTMPIIGFANRGIAALVAYDREFVRLNKILGDSVKTMSNLEDQLFAMSNKFGVSRDLITGVTADFAELGVTGDEVLMRLTELTNEVAILGTMDISDSQDLIQTMFLGTIRTLETMSNASIQSMNAMEKQELAIKSLTNQMYVFNAVENNTALSFRDMAESLPEVTAAVVPFGISLTQAAAFLAPMKAGGIDVSVAANGLKVSLQRLITPTGLLTKEMDRLTSMYSESSEVLRDAFDRTTGIGMSSIQGLIDATMELRDVADDETVLRFYSLLFQKRQSTRMLTAMDSLVAFQREMNTGPFAQYTAQLNNIVANMNSIHDSAIPAIKDIETFTLVTSIANSMAGETVQGFVGPLAEKDIQAARQAREEFREYIKDIETTSADGVQIVDTITSQAGKTLFVELLGASNAAELAQKELNIALNSTSKSMDRIKIGLKNMAVELLSVLEGPIKAAGNFTVRVAEAFRGMPEILKIAIVSFFGLATAIGPAVFIGGQLKLAFGVLTGAFLRFIPAMSTVTAESIIAAPAMLRLKRSVQLTGDGFSTSAGRFSMFVASLASGEGRIASVANRLGLMTGILKKQTTAGLGVEAAISSQTAMGGRSMKQLVDDAFSESMATMTTAASTAASTTTTAATTAGTTATTAASTAAGTTTSGATTAASITTNAATNASATMVAGATQSAAILSAATGKPLSGASKTASGALTGFAAIGAAPTASQTAAALAASTGKPLTGLAKTGSGAISGFAAMGAAPLSGSIPKSASKPQLSSTVKAGLFNKAQERALNNLRQGLTIDAYNDLQLAHIKGQEKVVKIVDRGGQKIRQVQKDIDVQDFKNFDTSVKRRYNGLVNAEVRRLDLIAQQQAAAKAQQLAASNAAGKAAAAQQAANAKTLATQQAAQQSAQAKQNYKAQQSLARKRLYGIDAAKQRRDAINARQTQRQAGIDAAKQRRDMIANDRAIRRQAGLDAARRRRDFFQSPAQQARRANIEVAKDRLERSTRRQYGIDFAKNRRDQLAAERAAARRPMARAKKFIKLDYVDDAAKGSLNRVSRIFNKLPNVIKGPFGKVGRIFSTLFNFGPLKSGLNFIVKGFKAFAFPALKILDVILKLNKSFKIFKILIGGLGLGLIAGAVALLLPYIKAVVDYFEVFKVKTSGAVKALKQAFDNVKAAVMAIISPFQDFISSLMGGGSNGYQKMSAIADIVNKVSDFILKASEAVRSFVEDYVEPFIRKALGALQEFIGGFVDIIKAAINMKNGVEGSGEAMKEGLNRVFNGIVQFVLGTVVPAIVSAFFALAKGVLKIFIAIVQRSPSILGMLVKIFLKVVNIGLDLFKAFVMGVFHLWANLPKYAAMAFNKVLNVIVDFANLAIDIIATIARNVINLGGLLSNIPGFDGLVNTVFNFVEEKVGGATVAVENFGQSVEDAGASLTDNLVGMLGGVDRALSSVINGVQSGLDGVGNAAANAGSWLSDFIDAPLASLEDGLDGILDSLKNTINDSLKRFEPTPIGERVGRDITDGARDALDGDQIFEPEMESAAEDAGAAAGESFAEKFAEALKGLQEKFVGLVKDFIGDKIKSVTDELTNALEAQRETALNVFDEQLKALDALEKAEQSLMREREFIANRKKILDERELNRQNYMRNRALAIYEGRIDDARMLDLEEQKSAADSASSLQDLQDKRNEELRKENLDFLKDQIKEAKEAADEFFREQIEAFKTASQEITKFAPNTIEDYQKQLDDLVALATGFAEDNAAEFSQTFENMNQKISSDMPNKVVGVFGENLDDMIAVAIEKYGLGDMNSGIVGATTSMLENISNSIDTSNVLPSWVSLLGDIENEVLNAGTGKIAEVIEMYGPQKVLEEAIDNANQSILHEWRGTLGHIASEVEGLVGFMDPMLTEILKAQTAFEMLADAARSAGSAASGATGGGATGGGPPGGGPSPSNPPVAAVNPPAPASAAIAASVRSSLSAFLSGRLPASIVPSIVSQMSGGAINIVRQYMTNSDLNVRRSIYATISASMGGNLNLFKDWVTSRYGAAVTYTGGGGANASGSGRNSMLLANGGYVPKFANQSIPATLHGGEFVVSANAVKNIGMATLQSLNNMRFSSPSNYSGNNSGTTINKTSTTNIYVETFVGEDKWFQSMLKEYNIKHKPIAEKQMSGGNRFYSTYRSEAGY